MKGHSLRKQGMNKDAVKNRTANKLIHELSPYLLQHAYNPVNWYPWGEEAFKKAREEDKPIFLSIGYSSCHWCHVMAHESFEDEEIAKFLNEHFINIKVDREERPDIDEVYMNALQVIGGQGGWPLNLFLTPTLEPFYGGTYFPPAPRRGLPGFLQIISKVIERYKLQKENIIKNANEVTQRLKIMSQTPKGEKELSDSIIKNAVEEIKQSFDAGHGGFGDAPKFPRPMDIQLLLRYWARTKDPQALHMVLFSLEKMAQGGIYDQLGGGFHRYSVDEAWLVPHFEKMLYDNALLSKAYLEAFQATQNPLFRQIAEEVLEYVTREMTSQKGGFYSAQDADTDMQEGKYYIWGYDEIISILGKTTGETLCRYFGITPYGNFEDETTVLHIATSPDVIAEIEKRSVAEIEQTILEGKVKLFTARKKKGAPFKDEKILTGWNALMLSAFAIAARILKNPHYLQIAIKNAVFIKENLFQDGVLYHLIKDGKVKQKAFLDDYTFLINALLDLFEASFEPAWLEWAKALTGTLNKEFSDPVNGGYFYTGDTQEELITRSKNPLDNVLPSGNSMGTFILFRLAKLTGNKEYLMQGLETIESVSQLLERIPGLLSQILIAIDYHLFPGPDIVIVGPVKDKSTNKFIDIATEYYDPNRLVIVNDPSCNLSHIISWLSEKPMIDGKVTAYYCKEYTCLKPATKPEELSFLMES